MLNYALNSAKQLGKEGEIGSLGKDKRADFVVLTRSLFNTDVYEINDVKPDMVVIDGRVVQGNL